MRYYTDVYIFANLTLISYTRLVSRSLSLGCNIHNGTYLKGTLTLKNIPFKMNIYVK